MCRLAQKLYALNNCSLLQTCLVYVLCWQTSLLQLLMQMAQMNVAAQLLPTHVDSDSRSDPRVGKKFDDMWSKTKAPPVGSVQEHACLEPHLLRALFSGIKVSQQLCIAARRSPVCIGNWPS